MGEKEVLRKAKQLGITIGKSKIWNDFNKATEKFKKDNKVQKLLKDLQEKEKKQKEKLKKGIPVEIEEKHDIKRLEKELSESKIFVNFITTENHYLSLMEKIEIAIREGTEEAMSSFEKRRKGETEKRGEGET